MWRRLDVPLMVGTSPQRQPNLYTVNKRKNTGLMACASKRRHVYAKLFCDLNPHVYVGKSQRADFYLNADKQT